jgi:hypothetical protein
MNADTADLWDDPPPVVDLPPIVDSGLCFDCDAPLDPGRKLRCNACVEAARVAIREANGRTVRPSDVARIRSLSS